MKSKSIILRLSERDNTILSVKADLLGTNKSKLLRDGAFFYWNGDKEPDATFLLQKYTNGTDKEKEIIVDLLFEYYRRTGYPHNYLSPKQLQKEMIKLANTKSPILEDNHLQVNTTGISLANHFHPHMNSVRCMKGYLSPYELYANDDRLKDAIKRWMDIGSKPSHSGIRRILRTRDGVRSVVNFKPPIAQYFYKNYCPNNGKVLDPCAGYGGRLAAVISCNKNIHYHGIDPCGKTAAGNMQMASFYASMYDPMFKNREWEFDFDFSLGCAEDVMPNLHKKYYDLIFTSPPYFDQEQYSLELNQSYLRHPEYEKWRDNFLFKIFEYSVDLVKDDGYIIFNVKDYREKMIASDLLEHSTKMGLKLYRRYEMRLSNSEYHRKKDPNNKDKLMWHSEPIFVFKK